MWFQSPASICVQWSVWHWVLSMFDEGRTDYLLQKLLLCTFVSILKQFILTQLVWSWYFCRVDCSFVKACGHILISKSIRCNSPAWAPFPLVCFKTKYQQAQKPYECNLRATCPKQKKKIREVMKILKAESWHQGW